MKDEPAPRWASVVSAPGAPLDPKRREELARLASERIDALLARLERRSPGREPEQHEYRASGARERHERDEALELASMLCSDDPLEEPDLANGERLLGWMRRRAAHFEWWERPDLDFFRLVVDGRPDLSHLAWEPDDEHDEDDEEPHEQNPALEGEDVRSWSILAHGHDGHRSLFWDRSTTGTVRVVRVDNTLHEVIERDFETSARFLLEEVIPTAANILREELDRELGIRRPPAEHLRARTSDKVILAVIVCVLIAITVALLRACA